ncbi:MAG TPA: CoA transferase [Candidatus Aphodovivens avistercoris]|nr:CoA transferase [Candidatus Aphodovivens avistercoris]
MSKQILEGVKILDFGAFMAGPAAAEFLGFLGAEVIKVEHPLRPDGTRFFLTSPKQLPPDPRTAGSQTYDVNNYGKQSLALDFKQEEGKEILWKLIEDTDVITQNMSAGTMERLGFGYEEVRKRKPDIIYLSSSACGEDGPERDFIGYAATFAAKAGLGALTGYEGYPPSTFVGSIDIRSASFATIALLAALYHRKKTGLGQYIEISSQEAIAAQLGEFYLDYSVNGHNQGPMANRRHGYAPQGAYRVLGDDQWATVSVETQEQWESLCRAIGNPQLASDERFATYEDRFSHADELDEIITAWTKDKEASEVVEKLQAAGVPSGWVYNGKGLHEDPHRREREAWYAIDSRDLGKEYVMRPAWRFEKTPVPETTASPYLGEHSVQILKNRLGMTDQEIAALVEKRVVRRLLDYDSHL